VQIWKSTFLILCATFKNVILTNEQKNILLLFSTRLMALLFLSFAIAMGVDFIESKYNTDTARILIYNAWWFEAIMVFCD
jgi:hypothetical protein